MVFNNKVVIIKKKKTSRKRRRTKKKNIKTSLMCDYLHNRDIIHKQKEQIGAQAANKLLNFDSNPYNYDTHPIEFHGWFCGWFDHEYTGITQQHRSF